MDNPLVLILVGLVTGIYSGIMGLGGGTIMIPLMVLMLQFSQHQAVATSLAAMLPPVALPAVIRYYYRGDVKISTAAWIALGITAGTFMGASVAGHLSDRAMRLIFGFVLIYVGAYTVFGTLGKQYLIRSISLAGLVMAAAAVLYVVLRWQARA